MTFENLMVNRKSQISIRDIQKLRSQLGGREGVSQKVTWPKREVSKKATIGYEGRRGPNFQNIGHVVYGWPLNKLKM